MKIAICAGHHEAAKGAVNRKHNLNEHDEAKKVAHHLTDILSDQGHTIYSFPGGLSTKIADINAAEVDLAVDVHFNAGGGRGCEVVYVPGSETRREQAANMSREIALYMNLRDRGAKEGWYMGGDDPGTKPDAFVTQTNCPAFIPEPLFIDNDKEVEHWFVAGRHKQLAEALALGIEAVL